MLNQTRRTWININRKNLAHNIQELKHCLQKNTKIMAVLKANAYGHGLELMANALQDIGITDYAVATLYEGIRLRESGIVGNILILGYTDSKDISYVLKYNLIQTIVDASYAECISSLKLQSPLRVHLKIDTGMHRIGEDSINIDKIASLYKNPHFQIEGIYSHLCVADSLDPDDINFTKSQIQSFDMCLSELQSRGFSIGKTHIQSSYGVLNYPELKYDYVRIGMSLYGTAPRIEMATKLSLNLRPVLSLYTVVTNVKTLKNGESIGYGRSYVCKGERKIATLAIGYADGYPRALSNRHAKVMFNGALAEVVGTICMDQMMVDVTGIDNVYPGDIACIVGDEKELTAEYVAHKAGIITCELLSGLSDRITRYIE